MHVVHYPNNVSNNIQASAIAILFDVNNYDTSVTQQQINTIDNFFDSLLLNQFENPISPSIPFG
jgi:hypothetical protein